MSEPERREEHRDIEEREEQRNIEPERDNLIGYAAIKYAAIVIIVLAILYFLAVFVVPLIARR